MGVSRLLLPALLLAACGDDLPARPDAYVAPDMRQPPDADFGAVPRVEPVACRFQMGTNLGLTEGTDYACGDLVVEEDREAHTGRLRLHYIRIKSTAATNRGTIYLDGGPGGDGQGILDYAAYLGNSFLDGLLVDGDFLVIGQRGTSRSLPFLECGGDCSALSAIAHLPSFNTAYNADDVNDLRATLGLDKLNLYGISYGSRLGLEVLRRHGDHVRSAVIEGLVPSQTHWPAAIPASFYSALTALHQSCADAGSCGTAFGDLVAKFSTAVDALDLEPVPISTSGGDFDLDGGSFAYIMFRVMYSRSSYEWLPLIINDLAIRRTDRVNDTIAGWLEADVTSSDVSRGLYYSVVCGELYNPPDPSAPAIANANVPSLIVDLFGGSYYSLESTCDGWPKGNLQASLAQPVTSAVRTFVSSGRLDPITPPSFGTVAAANLSNAFHVIHENSGHGATLQSPCGTQNLVTFLADPDATLDTSCAATITTTFNVPPMAWTPPVSKARLRAELSLSPLPPLGPRLRNPLANKRTPGPT